METARHGLEHTNDSGAPVEVVLDRLVDYIDQKLPVNDELSLAAAAVALGTAAMAHAAVTDTGVPQTVTTGFTQPSTPRNVTATFGGTATDIKAIAVVVHGTNFDDEVISETLPVATENTAGIVTGNKAFKTITSVVIPAHDGTGATTSIGYGTKLGLPAKLKRNTVLAAFLNGVRETTAPTVAFSATVLESNTVILNSALNGSDVVVDYYRPV